jgi:hypothetical protein
VFQMMLEPERRLSLGHASVIKIISKPVLQ